MSKKTIIITDRYSVLPYNGCESDCEGTGYIPVKSDESDPVLKKLWDEAELKNHSGDGWHFVVCPKCGGKRKT